MNDRVVGRSDLSSGWPTRSPSEMLRHIEVQVEALMNQHGSLMIHKRAIERQLASIAARIHEPDVELTPCTVFLLLEMRGSGGVSEQLEHIAHIVHEQGYWKPNGRVQNYRLQEVYCLGKSAQRLFDTYAVVDLRVQQLHAWLGHIKQRWQMEAETPPQGVFADLAAAMDTADVQGEINALVKLLEQPTRFGWFRWLFGHGFSE
jgi:hypothetical protein